MCRIQCSRASTRSSPTIRVTALVSFLLLSTCALARNRSHGGPNRHAQPRGFGDDEDCGDPAGICTYTCEAKFKRAIWLLELDKVNCKSTGHPITAACVDTVGWVGARGYTCFDHLQLGYCTVDEQTSVSYAMADGVGAHQAYLLVPLLALRQYASRMLQITNAPTMARNAPFAHLAIGAPRACQS